MSKLVERIVVQISKEEKEKIFTYCEEHCMSVGALVRKLLKEYIDQNK